MDGADRCREGYIRSPGGGKADHCSGLNLGKEKYGGPFTNEDVKTFYGILKVLLSFGIVFFLDFAANSVLPLFNLHVAPFHDQNQPTHNQTLTEVILVPAVQPRNT